MKKILVLLLTCLMLSGCFFAPQPTTQAPTVTDGDTLSVHYIDVGQADCALIACGGEYIGNKNSKTLHLPTCSSLPKEENRIIFDDYDTAIAEGYKPCSRCMG